MRTQLARIKKDIETLAQFNSTPGEGLTRLSYTMEYKQAQEYVIHEMKQAGLSVRIDPAGNTIGRWDGTEPDAAPVMSGSHLDSVPHGGIFDGISGVITALEAARVVSSEGMRFVRPIEVIVFVEEEGGGRFRSGLFGSRALAGKITRNMVREIVDARGISIAKAMEDFGLDPDKIEEAAMEPASIHAFIELHIEQGPVLDENNVPLGIVTAIFGIEEGTVTLSGVSGHAGAIPMALRHDPMTATANMIMGINQIAKSSGTKDAVGTVGLVQAYPGVINIIPDNVVFTYDVRDTDNDRHQRMLSEIKEMVARVAGEYGVKEDITVNLNSPAVRLNERVIAIMEDIAKEKGLSAQSIVSGAGHDAMVMPAISEHVNMIFARSKGGHSHRPDERTEFEDLQAGSELLLETITRLANE